MVGYSDCYAAVLTPHYAVILRLVGVSVFWIFDRDRWGAAHALEGKITVADMRAVVFVEGWVKRGFLLRTRYF